MLAQAASRSSTSARAIRSASSAEPAVTSTTIGCFWLTHSSLLEPTCEALEGDDQRASSALRSARGWISARSAIDANPRMIACLIDSSPCPHVQVGQGLLAFGFAIDPNEERNDAPRARRLTRRSWSGKSLRFGNVSSEQGLRSGMDYAVVRTGGKQYRVSPGDLIHVESLAAEPGSTVELGEVLLAAADGAVRIGTPLVEGAKVTATVVGHGKARKILVFKMKRRKNQRRKRGHRQRTTTLRVLEIQG